MKEVYKGYYKNYLLVISKDKKAIKKYFRNILRIDDFYIESELTNWGMMKDEYSGYKLEEYADGLFITERDYNYLSDEIRIEFQHILTTLDNMKDYYHIISKIDNMDKQAKRLKESIDDMENDIHCKKVIKVIKKRIIKSSDLFKNGIDYYIRCHNMKNEVDDLDDQYMLHIL